MAAEGIIPGGSRRNLDWASEFTDPTTHDELTQVLIADAQTSGGLVFGVDPSETGAVLTELASTAHQAALIGRTEAASGPAIILI